MGASWAGAAKYKLGPGPGAEKHKYPLFYLWRVYYIIIVNLYCNTRVLVVTNFYIQKNNHSRCFVLKIRYSEKCLKIPGTEAYSEPSQTSEMELFAEIDNSIRPLTIFAKSSILNIWLGSEYAFDVNNRHNVLRRLHFFYKQLVLGWQIAKQLSGLKPLSVSNNKRLKKSGVFSLQ